ncbi:MAG TPA: formylmethanofuran dehydrogenase subunit A, partial [Planctomycetaceae bacterium]|nr:formylmethanofuran dehydrogenase subunit A [Planctomycetaceae bacterium]
TFATGWLYAGLGYTTAFDAAVPPLLARHAVQEFCDTPVIDKGFFALLGNNRFVLEQIAAGERHLVVDFMAWLLQAVKAYAPKLVNPGGVEQWKSGAGDCRRLDDPVAPFGVTPRQILVSLAEAAQRLRLPHPVHVHCNNLGRPGNWSTTLETFRALDGLRAHITHIQFHSYGGDPDDPASIRSEVPRLVEYVASHPDLTVDVGQVLFGKTVAMTGDGPLGDFLHHVTGKTWFNADVELEAGCGVLPIEYRDRRLLHGLQWAIGLEWYLLMDDPWRIALTTDHPNGASFLAYPEVIALLMDRSRRQETLRRLPAAIRERSVLGDLNREYSLYEVAIITRAAPARILGLDRKGHLGVGADADVTIYEPHDDVRTMFEHPRYVLCRGELVLDDGQRRTASPGRLFHVVPEHDDVALSSIRRWFHENSTVRWANYPLRTDEFLQVAFAPCKPVE